jgi:hypothetical protein
MVTPLPDYCNHPVSLTDRFGFGSGMIRILYQGKSHATSGSHSLGARGIPQVLKREIAECQSFQALVYRLLAKAELPSRKVASDHSHKGKDGTSHTPLSAF